ncbi:hypothetical protein [Flexivirga caeni]|uniref:Uncharacterized protein n=1 Tax=Flexivirga caeni TaxID=2294115 RepID=A0A3M9ME98_9MICO|nr:hypothetical protein [Flexivirga caeni]RNI23879.1 hypothetical protein EFY87_06315 [Flexivirga caeni]
MTDETGDPAEPQPRRRRHRRARSAATTGHPDAGRWTYESAESGGSADSDGPAEPSRPGRDATQDSDIGGAARRVAGSDEAPESAQDRWWHEQRPPHWE